MKCILMGINYDMLRIACTYAGVLINLFHEELRAAIKIDINAVNDMK